VICFVSVPCNELGKIVYVSCSKVVFDSEVYDWEVDGLPPHLKHRVLKTLSNLKAFLKLS
jgi:hypothetical protein